MRFAVTSHKSQVTSHKSQVTSHKILVHDVWELAGGLGFEPRLAESESAVLPLDDPPMEVQDTGYK